MFAYNTSVHEATNFTPYELVFGRVARTPSSFPQGEEVESYGTYLRDLIVRVTEIRKLAAKSLIKANLRSKENNDQKARPLNAKIGDQVYVVKDTRDGKFDSRAHGPYAIVAFTQYNNVTLETGNGKRFSKHAVNHLASLSRRPRKWRTDLPQHTIQKKYWTLLRVFGIDEVRNRNVENCKLPTRG